MRFIFAAVCVCLAVGSVYSAVQLLPAEPTPPKYEGQPGCYNKELDIMLPLNELYSPCDGICRGYLCKDNSETEIQTCGAVSAPGCKVTEDLSLPYPDCCKQYTDCPTSDGQVGLH